MVVKNWLAAIPAILLASTLAAVTAAADAPVPKPAAEAPAAGAEKPEEPPKGKSKAPSLKDVRGTDFAAALAEARKAAAAASATPEKQELLAGLLLLTNRSEEARLVLARLYPAKDRSDPETALAVAIRGLADQVRKQPDRKKGEKYSEEEVTQRLRLALAILASGRQAERQGVKEWEVSAEAARDALAPLQKLEGTGERLRLALLGLAASAPGRQRSEALRDFEELYLLVAGETQLGLRALTLVDSVKAFGVYTERAVRTCRTGEELKAYCEVLNFACRQIDPAPAAGGERPEVPGASFLTALDVDLTFLEDEGAAAAGRDKPEASRVVLHSRGYAQVRHRTRSDIRDLHLVIHFRLPQQFAYAEGKHYWLKVTVRDMATGKEAVSAPLELAIDPGSK
jgi:hypothetical protein